MEHSGASLRRIQVKIKIAKVQLGLLKNAGDEKKHPRTKDGRFGDVGDTPTQSNLPAKIENKPPAKLNDPMSRRGFMRGVASTVSMANRASKIIEAVGSSLKEEFNQAFKLLDSMYEGGAKPPDIRPWGFYIDPKTGGMFNEQVSAAVHLLKDGRVKELLEPFWEDPADETDYRMAW